MAYSELIKDYQKIRTYMRQFYVYGFKSREDYAPKNRRSYDNERRRIESWLGDYLSFHRNAEGKQVFLSVDSRAITSNPLYKSLKTKSFTARDITLHFYLLDILAGGLSLTTTAIVNRIYQDYLAHFDTNFNLDASTIRKKLQEYVRLGLLTTEKSGCELYYRLTPQQVALSSWATALSFYAETAPLGVLGSFLLDKLPPMEQPFRFKHHYILHALDSEILYSLLAALQEHRCVQLELVNRQQQPLPPQEVLPLKIYTSVQSGRCFLLSYSLKYHSFRFYRVDMLISVTPGNIYPAVQELEQPLAEFQQRLWGVSYNGQETTEHLEVTLHFEPEEGYLVQRLYREKRCGSVQKLAEDTYLFTADVYDTLEMLPWLRTFYGRIKKLDCTNPRLLELYREDLLKMLALYGGEEDALSGNL